MTLFKQISITIAGLLMLMFVGSFAISLHNSRTYLIEQLGSHAQDAATSLGLSVSPHFASGDLVTAGSIIDAMFDRGYYRSLTVTATDGSVLFERKNEIRFDRVPAWFVRLFELTTPVGTATVMSGWNQVATVAIDSNPGYAYLELWRTAMASFSWLLASTFVGIGLALVTVRAIMRPLKAVEAQADAICRREFPSEEKLPKTRELRSVVAAMNRMVQKVKQMLEEQMGLTERMREQAFQDPVTGLGNRRYFDSQLIHLTEDEAEPFHGALILVELNDFKSFNDAQGFEAGDQLLQAAATRLLNLAEDEETLVTRLGGANFGILKPAPDSDTVASFCQQLLTSLGEMESAGLTSQRNIAHVGAAMRIAGQSSGEWLATTDQALRDAQSSGPNTAQIQRTQVAGSRGARDWKRFLQTVLHEGRIELHAQPVFKPHQAAPEYQELLLRIPDDNGELLPAGAFIPMIERHTLMPAFDQLVVEHLFRKLGEFSEDVRFAINLHAHSIRDTAFTHWLETLLGGRPDAPRLTFEIAEFGALGDLPALTAFVEQINRTGAGVALDRVGRSFTAFGYLANLKLRYLKVDGSYIREIQQRNDNQLFVQSLADIAHGLDLTIYAESVEDETSWRLLEALGIDGGQGFHLGRPRPLES
ncbi:MAG: EAL domain-containing protein [Gammaproteobacteria bacterium]|nr:EAL domain-containing protein [Gammaproteobacteria bacterium]